jgi:hypothetical protein
MPGQNDIKVLTSCDEATFDALVATLRERNKQVVVATDATAIVDATPTDVVVFKYLEDTHGDDATQIALLRRVMELEPTWIAARSATDEFQRALNAGDHDAMYTVGGANIRMDLFYRLVNYLATHPAPVG